MIYACCDRRRRDLVAASVALNGIDYLEVIDRELPESDPLRQRTLLVHCLKPLPASFSAANLQLLGGERVKNVGIEWAAPASPLPSQLAQPGEAPTAAIVSGLADGANTLVVRTGVAGDFSTYTLRFVNSATDDNPPDHFDPQLREIAFSFKVECPSDFDCKPQRSCPAPSAEPPEIDYLAKDYASFRRLLLDRMSQLVPQWQQTSEADFGIALAELLAYVGDELSYQQDAVATEAYLGTARRRISLRRHALLVDYPMHDGCNARAWLQLQIVPASFALRLAQVQFLTRCPGFPTGIASGSRQLDDAMLLNPSVFAPLLDPRFAPGYQQPLYAAHNRISFYTWSDDRCCLPRRATKATLRGSYPNLQVGDALLFEELVGPQTGKAGDADPTHRQVVRVTRRRPDASAPALTDPLTGDEITEIEWALEDALKFALCVSAVTDADHGSKHLTDVSVARGNLVLVDHGRLVDDNLGKVPQPTLFDAPDWNADRCSPPQRVEIPPRYHPQLPQSPLTQAAGQLIKTQSGDLGSAPGSYDPLGPASQALESNIRDVLPQIRLDSQLNSQSQLWQAKRDLLNSAANASDFVVEVDDDGIAQLRFGDDVHGERPEPDTMFTSAYRIGNGAAGNVGAESIVHFVASAGDLPNVLSMRNPLPAQGGVDPEDAASVRRNAPEAFRTQERAVTTDDYAAVVERNANVQRAAATLRWTGSWYTVFNTVDPVAGADAQKLKADLAPFVNRYRMAGQDLEFNDPQYVSLEIDLHVCVKDDYFRSDVRENLLELFGTGVLPDGRPGVFNPDNLSFGQSVFLAPFYAAAHRVPGVASVEVTKFQRQGTDDPSYLMKGELPLGRLEIARLDNDPNFPEHGVLKLDIHGGR
jgi:hypothetical protein